MTEICEYCHIPFERSASKGPRPKFCSGACRQAAHRQSKEFDPAKMIGSMHAILETLAPLTEASLGYRAQLEAAGYSPTIAELMAAEFHRLMLNKAFEKS